MARRKTEYPGSIFVRKGHGTLVVKVRISPDGVRPFKYKKIYTPYPDTPVGRKEAEKIKKRYYEERLGIVEPLGVEYTRETIKQAFAEYITYCRTKPSKLPGKTGLSKKTLRNYQIAYDSIVLKDFPFTADYAQKVVAQFLKTTKFGPVTINTYLNCFQIFLTWAAAEGKIPRTDIKKNNIKHVDYEPDPFTKEEAQKLMEHFKAHDWEFAVLIEVSRLTGARMVDLLQLYDDKIDWKNSEIEWRNKITKRPERVPVMQKALDLLKTLPKREDGKIFRWNYNSESETHSGNSRIYKKFNAGLKATGIEKRGRSLQNIRQLFCNVIFELDLPLADQLKLTRHKTVDVTVKHYLKAQDKRMKEALSKLE